VHVHVVSDQQELELELELVDDGVGPPKFNDHTGPVRLGSGWLGLAWREFPEIDLPTGSPYLTNGRINCAILGWELSSSSMLIYRQASCPTFFQCLAGEG
jgi:hypothetical protein